MSASPDDTSHVKAKEQHHALEQLFQMPASQILDVVLSNNRTLMNLKGAVAQEYLKRHLQTLKQNRIIEDFAVIDRDGQPDFRVQYLGSQFLIECKNVQQNKAKPDALITVDFWRTRNQSKTGNEYGRYYAEGEFQILASCLFNRTGSWTFLYIDVNRLPRLVEDPKRFRHTVIVGHNAPDYGPFWTSDLIEALTHAAITTS